MEITNLKGLLVEELKDIYSAENQLLKAMPRMARKASHPELKEAFELHLTETQGQVERLNQVFEQLGEKAGGKTCKAMKGLLEEAKEMMGEDMDDDSMDAALISAAQKVEHYEIASYGTVRSWAKLLKETEIMRLLQETLDEEGATDKKLTRLAVSSVNLEAAQEDEDEMAGAGSSGNGRGGSKRGRGK
jgi:ferritin-like metal-binding protein YciE